MTWERALEADARLAARNALLVRAALRQQFDAERAYQGYLSTTPDKSLSLPQQRVRARAWAIINIRPNLEPLKAVVEKMWGEGLLLGELAATEAIEEAKEALKLDTQSAIDWSKWKPGDEAAALVAKRPGLMNLLRQAQGFSWKSFSDTTLKDIGDAVGEAIYLGLDAKRSAKNIMNHVASPARALTIAITEQNRAVSYATTQRYREAGLTQMEWLVFDPCKICAQNEGQVVEIGHKFASGDQRPPAHPNCRCALAPVIPGFDEPLPGATVIGAPTPPPVGIPDLPAPVEEAPVRVITTGEFVPGQWGVLTQAERRQRVLDKYIKLNPNADPKMLEDFLDRGVVIPKADIMLVKKGIVYQNGPIEVQFYSAGANVPAKVQKDFLKEIEELQILNPREKMTIHVASNAGNAYGSALLGDAQIWLKPTTVMDTTFNKAELGYKMPVIGEVAQRRYTIAHEWGHTLDEGGSFTRTESIQNATTKQIIEDLKKEFEGKAFMSKYSGENTKEFYAEMFAEFYLTNGQTSNPLVQAMAKKFGWKAPAAPVVSTPVTPVAAYVPAKQPVSYFTPQVSNTFYAKNAAGEIDYSSYNRDGQNLYLKNILEVQGFNGKPMVVSAEEYAKYVKQGAVPIYRGVAGTRKAQPGEYVKQFLEGNDPFVGKGMFGDGTYFANAREVAEEFSRVNVRGQKLRYGAVIDGALHPQAKIIDLGDVTEAAKQIFGDKKYEFAQDFYDDTSAVAAALGYDAIRIPKPPVRFGEKPLEIDYYIILNRTAVIVKEMK